MHARLETPVKDRKRMIQVTQQRKRNVSNNRKDQPSPVAWVTTYWLFNSKPWETLTFWGKLLISEQPFALREDCQQLIHKTVCPSASTPPWLEWHFEHYKVLSHWFCNWFSTIGLLVGGLESNYRPILQIRKLTPLELKWLAWELTLGSQ